MDCDKLMSIQRIFKLTKKYVFIVFTVSLLTLLFSAGGTLAYGEESLRIISLKPNISDIIDDLGMASHLVGVTSYCEQRHRQGVSVVGDYVHVQVEKVLSLKPDIVFASQENSLKKEVDFLRKMGVRVMVLPFSRLDQMYDSIGKIAQALHRVHNGDLLVRKIKEGLKELKRSLSTDWLQRKFLFLVGHRPFVVVGGQNFMDDVFRYMGWNNLARQSRIPYPVYSLEKLIGAQPQVVVDLGMGSESGEFYSIPALRSTQWIRADMSDFRPSANLLKGMRTLLGELKKEHRLNPIEN